MENTMELKRSNKITAYWEGDGVAVGIFYKTHDKIATVKSNDDAVIGAGFVMPESTDENPVTASQKLEAFKTFLSINASVFGIAYDPVDRRADQFKFPGKYNSESFAEYSKKMAEMAITDVLESVQKNVIDKMIKAGHVAEGAQIAFGIGEATISIDESYANGNIKYGKATYPIAFALDGKQVDLQGDVELVSGQLKKPRTLGETVLTMTGIKTLLVDNGVLPKIEKPAKEDAEATEAVPTDAPADAE